MRMEKFYKELIQETTSAYRVTTEVIKEIETAYEKSIQDFEDKQPSESQKVTATDSCKNTF